MPDLDDPVMPESSADQPQHADEPDSAAAGGLDESEDEPEVDEDPWTRAHRSVARNKLRMVREYEVTRNQFPESVVAFGDHTMAAHTINVHPGSAGSRDTVRCLNISSDWISQQWETFVVAPGHSHLVAALNQRSLLFLDGPPGTGRETSAYLSLARRHGGDRVAVVGLADRVTVADAALKFPDVLRPDHGHVFRLPARQLIDAHVLAGLEAAAADRNATVVLLGELSPAQKAVLRPYLAHHDPPSPTEVFQRRLVYLLADRCVGDCGDCTHRCVGQYVTDCLANPTIQEELTHLSSPSETVAAAYALADGIPRGPDAGMRLKTVAMARLRGEAADALAPADEPGRPYHEELVQHTRAFRICYALLHGQPLRDVFEATARMRELLDQARGWERTGSPTYHMSVAELLGPGLGRLTPRTTPEPGVGRRAELRTERLMSPILDVVWNDYPGFRRPLLRWLDRLVYRSRPPVRQQAATIAGALAGYDYDQVYPELIERWSRSRRIAGRQAAAYAMEVAASGHGLAERVRGQVRQWGRSSKLCRDTAARCYATGFGQLFPQDGLEDLKRIAADPMQRSSTLIGDAIVNLTNEYPVGKLLDELISWVEPPSTVAIHGVRAFVTLAGERGQDGTPGLMRRFCDEEADAAQLALIWRCVLGWPAASRPAWSALNGWIGALDAAVTAGSWDEPVRTLLRDIFRIPALRERGIFQLRRVWRSDPLPDGFRWFAMTLEEG